MGLADRLYADLVSAMKAKDVPRRAAIRMVRAAIKNAEIEVQRSLDDDEVMNVISREVKRRKEAIELFRQGGRDDLVQEEVVQVAILEEYLPAQLSRDDITSALQEIIAETGATGPKQMGIVMKQAMARFKGEADGKLVNQIARELLAQ